MNIIIAYLIGYLVGRLTSRQDLQELRNKNEQLKEVIKFYEEKGDNNEHTD